MLAADPWRDQRESGFPCRLADAWQVSLRPLYSPISKPMN